MLLHLLSLHMDSNQGQLGVSYSHDLSNVNTGVAGHAHQHWGPDFTARAIFVRSLALIMLLSSVAMALYATYNFRLRSSMLQ